MDWKILILCLLCSPHFCKACLPCTMLGSGPAPPSVGTACLPVGRGGGRDYKAFLSSVLNLLLFQLFLQLFNSFFCFLCLFLHLFSLFLDILSLLLHLFCLLLYGL